MATLFHYVSHSIPICLFSWQGLLTDELFKLRDSLPQSGDFLPMVSLHLSHPLKDLILVLSLLSAIELTIASLLTSLLRYPIIGSLPMGAKGMNRGY